MTYNVNGLQTITIVPGTSYTGLYAVNGSYNGVLSSGSTFVGAQHPCGALWVTVDPNPNPSTNIYAPDGSRYIYTDNTTGGYVFPGGNHNYTSIPAFVPTADSVPASGYMNFKTGQYYGKQLSDLTVVRASPKTVISSNGNITPITFNTLPLSDLGLLVETQITNLVPLSNTSGGAWNSGSFPGVITANTTDVLDPMGGNTATKVAPTTGTTNGYFIDSIPVTASTVYTFSFYARLGTMIASDFQYAIFDSTNAAFIVQNVVPTLTPAANGWARVTATFTTTPTQTVLRIYPFRSSPVSGGTAYTWGAQVELGSFPSSLILTSGSATVRGVDVISLIRPAVNPLASTMFFKGQKSHTPSTNEWFLGAGDGTLTNELSSFTVVTLAMSVLGTGLTTSNTAANVYSPGTRVRGAISLSPNSLKMSTQGNSATGNATNSTGVGMTKLNIGTRTNNTFAYNDFIEEIGWWDNYSASQAALNALTAS